MGRTKNQIENFIDAPKPDLQRTEQWYNGRLGKFTASEIHKLMGTRGLGQTGETYAKEKAIEEVFGQIEESFKSFDMQRGIDTEPIAFKRFAELMDEPVTTCGSFAYNEHSGASPDGLVGEDAILEIKCPRGNKFFKLVAGEEIDKEYFYQMQHQMLCTNRNKAYFFNFLIHEFKEYWHVIQVLRCDSTIELMKNRIEEATQLKLKYVELLKNNSQW
jgi:putative phage-type endonuclease